MTEAARVEVHTRRSLATRAGCAMARLYCFDFDDNIVRTNARVWTLDGPKTTAELARSSGDLRLAEDPFREFGPEHVDACQILPGPFLSTLGRAIDEGSPIAVISARALKEDDFRRLVARAARQLLGRELHNQVRLYCCNREDWSLPGEDAAARKCAAVAHFLSEHPGAVSIGFSDDDPKNLAAMRGLFAGLAVVRPDLRCRVYDALLGQQQQCSSSFAQEAAGGLTPKRRQRRLPGIAAQTIFLPCTDDC